MGSTTSDANEKQALDRIASGTKEEDWREAAVVLSRGSGAEIDHELMAMFHTALDRGEDKRAELVSRILAERDPDRDPSYTERLLPEPVSEPAGRADRLVDWLVGEIPVGAEEWGFTRLRRLEPVRYYADRLRHGAFTARLLAAGNLGDTADAAAFDVLLTALSDRSRNVRFAAVQSVRRLAEAGLAEEYSGHAVRQRLAELLSGDDRLVRVAAARTLFLFGDRALVTEALGRVAWWQRRLKRELEAVLRGDIPPLPKMWIGER